MRPGLGRRRRAPAVAAQGGHRRLRAPRRRRRTPAGGALLPGGGPRGVRPRDHLHPDNVVCVGPQHRPRANRGLRAHPGAGPVLLRPRAHRAPAHAGHLRRRRPRGDPDGRRHHDRARRDPGPRHPVRHAGHGRAPHGGAAAGGPAAGPGHRGHPPHAAPPLPACAHEPRRAQRLPERAPRRDPRRPALLRRGAGLGDVRRAPVPLPRRHHPHQRVGRAALCPGGRPELGDHGHDALVRQRIPAGGRGHGRAPGGVHRLHRQAVPADPRVLVQGGGDPAGIQRAGEDLRAARRGRARPRWRAVPRRARRRALLGGQLRLWRRPGRAPRRVPST